MFPLTGPNAHRLRREVHRASWFTRQVTSCLGTYIPAPCRSWLLEQCIYELEVATGR
jgi:hypothetical protein